MAVVKREKETGWRLRERSWRLNLDAGADSAPFMTSGLSARPYSRASVAEGRLRHRRCCSVEYESNHSTEFWTFLDKINYEYQPSSPESCAGTYSVTFVPRLPCSVDLAHPGPIQLGHDQRCK